MSTSAPDLGDEFPFQRIAGELRRRIEAGELAPGDRVPSTRDIVDGWSVAMATATKVLTELRHEGLVRMVPGVGTVVEGDRRANRRAPSPPRQTTGESALTSGRIVAAAVAVADAEGLSAVSMRRVASEIGVATMSLYRHVKDKDDLVVQMLDAMYRTWQLPTDPPSGWRPRLEFVARTLWGSCRQHPWLAPAMSIMRPQAAPGGLALAEFALATLDGLGLDHQTTFTAYITLINFVRGTAVHLELEAEDQAATGLDSEEWMDAQAPRLRAMVETGAFPVFLKYASQEYDFSLDELFEFGLGRFLDGLDHLVERRTGQAEPARPKSEETPMTQWTKDELDRIGSSDEIEIAALRPDGTQRSPVTIWVARHGDDLYVRSVNGNSGAWYRGTQVTHKGRVRYGGVQKDVAFVDAAADVDDELDAAYRDKYRRYSSNIVNSILTPGARATTVKLVPL